MEKLNAIIPWAVFEKPLAKALKRSDGLKGGRPPFPAVMMFKVLVLQALYNLSDDQAEFVIQDRLSFMRFLGLSLSQKVPDAKTIWLFRESLVRAGAIDNLFARFDKHLSKSGYLAKGGQIVDATITQAPKPHNSQDEKAAIKAGETPEAWTRRIMCSKHPQADAPRIVKQAPPIADWLMVVDFWGGYIGRTPPPKKLRPRCTEAKRPHLLHVGDEAPSERSNSQT